MSGTICPQNSSEFFRRCFSQINREYNGINPLDIDVSNVSDHEIDEFVQFIKSKNGHAVRVGSKISYGGRLQRIPRY